MNFDKTTATLEKERCLNELKFSSLFDEWLQLSNETKYLGVIRDRKVN